LFVAPNGTVDPTAFVAVGTPVNYSTGVDAGYFFGPLIAVPGSAAGSQVAIQVRAFNTAAGATYNAAASSPLAQLGKSNIVQNYILGGSQPPNAPIGLTSFNVTPAVVPEPSTIALGVIGAAALLLRRRRA
ncbi:MAG: hypothetical protein JWN25_1078, partial [Verrucomicrobiales bacterium]|nr:hypothetical protein [Verrucomicrobiales bacterium]